MNRRLMAWAAAALVLFVVWTAVVRIDISDGSRASVWIPHAFGAWPSPVTEVEGSSNINLSIFVSFGSEASSSPTTDATARFGHPGVGSAVDTADSQNINGSRFETGPRAGTAVSISVYVAAPVDTAPHDQFQLAIYDDVRGAPKHLLATSAKGTLTADAWNTESINATLQPTTAYWLLYNTNGSNETVNNATFTPVTGRLFDDLAGPKDGELTTIADRISSVGALTPTAIAVLIMGVLLARRRLWSGLAACIGFAVGLLIAYVLRETLFAPYGLFPSGHALRTIYVALIASLLLPRRVALVAGGLLVGLVCLSALYAGRHYSDEIIGGLLLGWAAGMAVKAVVSTPARRARAAVPSDVDEDAGAGLL